MQRAPLRVDEFGHELVRRMIAQIGERSVLHDAAFVHEDDLVAEISGFGESCVTRMAVCLSAQNFLQVVLQRRPNEWIERAERLVEQEHFRRKHERAHQADALTLAAGKFGRITLERFDGKLRERAKFFQTLRCDFCQMARHEEHVAARGEMRK